MPRNGDMQVNNAGRRAWTRAVARISPPLMAVGRLARARLAWRKFKAGKLGLRAAILVSRDYAAEFAKFRRTAG